MAVRDKEPMMEWRLTPKSQRDLRTTAARIRSHANAKQIRKELLRGLKLGAKPAVKRVQSAARGLPTKGSSRRAGGGPASRGMRRGLRDRIVDATSLQVRTTRNPGVKVRVAKNKMDDAPTVPMHMNRGRWRHPVFNRNVWVVQTSKKGWFDNAARRSAPEVRMALGKVLDGIEKRVNSKL